MGYFVYNAHYFCKIYLIIFSYLFENARTIVLFNNLWCKALIEDTKVV